MKKSDGSSTTWLWALLLAAELLLYVGAYLQAILPAGRVCDFFQDHASIQFWMKGQSLYCPLDGPAEAVFSINAREWKSYHYGAYNPHPPAAILANLPYGLLPYEGGALASNIVGLLFVFLALALLARELGVKLGAREKLTGLALLLPCSPLLQQVWHAQNNALILYLLTACWAFQRRGADEAAGLCLGAATAIKLSPGLLFFYFVLKGRCRAALTGVVAFAAIQALAWFLFGTDDFLVFLNHLGAHTARFRAAWLNSSLLGFFSRLFEASPLTPSNVPLVTSPMAGQFAAYGLGAVLVLATAWKQRQAKTITQEALAFGLWLTTMLLVSPLTWDHYFLMLAPALFIAWRWLPEGGGWAAAFGLVVLLLWANPLQVWNLLIPGGFEDGTAKPWQSATLIAFKHWGLWFFFGLQWLMMKQPGGWKEPGVEGMFRARPVG